MTTRRTTNSRGSPKRALRLIRGFAIPWVSGLIALIWWIQLIVSIPLSVLAHGIRRSWPIIDYPMYSAPHFEGEEIPRMTVVGISESADEVDIEPEDVGGGYWHFQIFVSAVRRGDERIIRDMVRRYETRHRVRLAALRVENRPLRWTNARVEAAPVEVLESLQLDSLRHNQPIP